MGACLGKQSKPRDPPIKTTATPSHPTPAASSPVLDTDAQKRAAEAAQRRLDANNAKNTGPISARLAAQKSGTPALKQAALQNLQERDSTRLIYD